MITSGSIVARPAPEIPPGGRADDFAWPRREVGKVDAKDDIPIAAATPADGTSQSAAAAAATQPPKPVKRRPRPAVINTEHGSNWPGFTPRAQPPTGRAAFAPDNPFGPGGFFTR